MCILHVRELQRTQFCTIDTANSTSSTNNHNSSNNLLVSVAKINRCVPKPTSASCIMLTSLAPSPMAAVTGLPGEFFIMATT